MNFLTDLFVYDNEPTNTRKFTPIDAVQAKLSKQNQEANNQRRRLKLEQKHQNKGLQQQQQAIEQPASNDDSFKKTLSVLQNNQVIEMDTEDFVEKCYQKSSKIRQFSPEQYYGNKEYKLKFDNPDQNKITHRATQMNFRLSEPDRFIPKSEELHRVAYYYIGLEDDGNAYGISREEMMESIRILKLITYSLKVQLYLMEVYQGKHGKVFLFKIVRRQKESIPLDIRVLLLGESGSGKTSLLGVLTSGEADDGNGFCRNKMHKNLNSLLSGKTERVQHTVIGFDSNGSVINSQAHLQGDHEKVMDIASKIVTFIDMGTHKRAHNHMIQIINSQFPDYLLLVVSAVQEFTRFIEDSFKLIKVNQLPFIILVTHIDVATDAQMQDLHFNIKSTLSNVNDKRVPLIVQQEEDIIQFSKQILKHMIIPVFHVSNLKIQTLNYFIRFLNLLPLNNELINNANMPSEYCIHNIFAISNKEEEPFDPRHLILAGTITKGVIKQQQTLQIGPDKKGNFYPVQIQEIQCNRVKVQSAQCGQLCTIKYKWTDLSKAIGADSNPIRKGMVLIDAGKTTPMAYWDFNAEIWLFDDEKHSKYINYSHQLLIHTQTTRQICKIIKDIQDQPDLEAIIPQSLIRQRSKSNDQPLLKKHQPKVKQQLIQRNQRKQSDVTHTHPTSKSQQNLSPLHQQQQVPRMNKSNSHQNQQLEEQSPNQQQQQLFVIEENEQQDLLEIVPGRGNLIRLRFVYYPEYIQQGMKLIINEPALKAIGQIKHTYY